MINLITNKGGDMKQVTARIAVCIGILFAFMGLGSVAHAAASPSLLIKRIQVGTPSDASDELVEIVNNGSRPIELNGLTLEYKSATGTSWSKKAVVTSAHSLKAHATWIFASKQAHDAILASGIAQSGGNLRLSLASQVLDQVAWGNGDSPEGTAIAAPASAQIIERTCSPECGDTQNNAVDFKLTGDTATLTVGSSLEAGTTAMTESYAIEITEIFPDPASPQADAKDEFIELYNAGGSSVTLIGWKLVSGKQSYRLDGVTIPPGQYVSLASAATKLGLANSGDTVSLIDAAGNTLQATPDYGAAKSGKSFGVTDGIWSWLDHPTPGALNAGILKEITTEKPEKAAKVSTKRAPTTARKTAGAKATSAKVAASNIKDAASSSSDTKHSETQSGFSSAWVLALLGLFAVGYGVYEYRPELLSLIARLRAKSQAGREPVKNPSTRRRN